MMRPVLNREEYMKLRDSRKQQATLKAVHEGDGKQKQRLEQMNYSCLPNEDGTLKGSTRMSSTIGMDIDHIAKGEMQAVKERILGKANELGLRMLEESARGEGYHLVFKRRPELTQEENLKWASDLLGVKYDDGAKDITRVFFTTTAAELIYLEDEIFEINEVKGPRSKVKGELETPKGEDGVSFHTSFKGIPYSTIIAEYWRKTGGEPSEGERNKCLHKLAANLRAICDDKEEWLLEIMPRFGLPEQEMKSIIHSACKEPTKGSRLMDEIVRTINENENVNENDNENVNENDNENDNEELSPVTSQLSPKKLPQGVRESIDAVGPQLAMPVVTAICPAIGALATGVTLDVHGQKKGLNLIAYIAGDFASGKGNIDPVWMCG